MDLKETYNRIAEDWHEDHRKDDWWIEGTDAFASLFKLGDEILDIGCAGGIKSDYLAKKGLRVTSIDLSENLIKIAKREYPNGEFLAMDMRDLDTLNRLFDGVFAQASLLHIPKKEVADVISKFVARLKPRGYLYIAVKGRRLGNPEEETVKEEDYGYPYERFFSYFDLPELTNYFKEAGLEIVHENIKTVGRTDWLQIVGKKN